MTKNKHDHTATKKIKAWLFAIMLLLPFLFLLPTGLYYGLNQNAQLSERTETINDEDYFGHSTLGETYESQDLVKNVLYTFNYIEGVNTANTRYVEVAYVGVSGLYDDVYIDTSLQNNTYHIGVSNFSFYYCIGQTRYSMLPDEYGYNFIFAPKIASELEEFLDETLISYEIIGCQLNIPNGDNTITTNTYTNDISTSIINAWNSTWQNPLFSWTNYSPFYAPMQSFTNVFGINDMQIANVLTYLATITAIYIVFDIIIELFTYLTHLIPRSD